MIITQSSKDKQVLLELLDAGKPEVAEQPKDYAGIVVLKPWGYEFQVFDNGVCSIWLACLKAGEAVSMHCHQRKQAMFIPLSDNITLHTFSRDFHLRSSVCINRAVFHSQENNSTEDGFFLEYEWPSEKSDLVRYQDRYGRERQGYEGIGSMVPMREFDLLQLPAAIRLMIGRAA